MDEKQPPKNSARQTPISLRLLVPEAGERRKMYRARNTLGKLRSFRISLESVPEALRGTKIVPLGELASKLGVELKRLLPAIEHGYLKLVTSDPPTVYEPPPAAIEWLRVMYQPLSLRPFLSSEMVGELEGFSAEHVRQLCLDYNIPIYSDPVFGELMSISAFYRFHQQMHSHREPSRFDRQGMIWALMHLISGKEWTRDVKPPRFSRRLELEIRRIAGLKEPARTDAALRLWTAWTETRKVFASIAAAQGKEVPEFNEVKRLERMLEVETAPESNSTAPEERGEMD